MVSDKTIHTTFRIHKTLLTKPIRDFLFCFTIYQNYTLALKQNIPSFLHTDGAEAALKRRRTDSL